ncbi:MAG: chromate resistance protein [Dehalococcoidia bacterium]|nr:chromate resistance protein [Dehalococcoidia bacterium]
MAVWRRLRRAGAVALKSGLYVLPATDECIEAMQWLAQEARAEGADPIVIRAEMIEGLTEGQIVQLFHEARRDDYAELLSRAEQLDQQLRATDADATSARAGLERLRADYQQVRRVDFFNAPDGRQVGLRLDAVASALATPGRPEPAVPPAAIDEYHGRRWVTRPRPFVDRLACAWLIRRFIDSAAEIAYRDTAADNEVGFDMNDGTFGHRGNRCTLEVMLEAFTLHEPALTALAQIVHEIDLHDGRYARPEVVGLESVLTGWRDSGYTDAQLEAAGLVLFDGLYESARRAAGARP